MKRFLAAILLFSMIAGMLGACSWIGSLKTTSPSGTTDPETTSTTTTTKEPDGTTTTSTTTTTKKPDGTTTTSTTTTAKKPDGTTTTSTTTTTKKPDGTTTTSTTTTTKKPDGTTTTTTSRPQENPNPEITGDIEFILTGYSFETIFCAWKPVEGADSYNVYCNGTLVDKELTRYYGEYYRCDILGLSAGTYRIDVIPVQGTEEITDHKSSFTEDTISHIREGFAFVGGTASGAYNEDGTLKSDAVVVYVTNENKDTVSLDMRVDKNKIETKVGVQNIILGLKKGYFEHPLCIRFIGNIEDPAVLDKGDLKVDINKGAFDKGLTIEGVGNDATFNGFGLCVKGAKNVEIRNLGFMNCDSDEGDNISLQQDNSHIWVHNCDLFYGLAGKDADQAKGDGALDTKTSTNITLSFNHFIDTGKSNLQGMKSESTENCITYHHNWYDHSDSRHPRVRTCTVHVYNNYYDGVSKYGVGATMGSSVFVENNYFRSSNYTMLISKQGSDISSSKDGEGTFSGENGGIIKAYGNILVDCKPLVTYQQNSTQFDCYLASTRDETVPSSVKAFQGGSTYNNFDTASSMYSYNVQSAENAKETVMNFAGRVQGGDFKWTFSADEDKNYNVIPDLKSALLSYKGTLVSTNVTSSSTSGGGSTGGEGGSTGGEGGSTGGEGGTITAPVGDIVWNMTAQQNAPAGITVKGNYSTSKGTKTYGELTLTRCLKMESSTSITFTLSEARTLIMVFDKAKGSVKIDGSATSADSNGVVTVELEAGDHTITKGDSMNLFYFVIQ